ncbi:helix-turn-helix transcriptional regulator [Bacillus cereus group sp. Bc005]|nr:MULTISPECIES: helix-turn-helix transcriptional regulator [unclassified Bacillus cereus group]MED1213249.1 helix-turn-helix transcriptional regulator [Bacillus paranthracis]MDA2194504.1 helix-turn-helix transcriptional regulator [Bacillus cereus group sp. Bc238]MDA2200280.1 helix-turn-helix transcriptional regulator [Bacillus cereus group sp. Bc237]MDA2758304.1 helix-turn-helix transcriptional regulator [Bacillus cereus group sp. Bc007]MDA2763972.1 helix-turn-helix transcriptional regulator 
MKVQNTYTRSETVNKNIKLIRARKKSKLTQQDLAKRMKVTKSTISNWENGYSNPNLEKAIRLATILDSDVKDLI